MEWSSTAVPSQLKSCGCGSTSVEVKPDGLVRHYRCADCRNALGDLTMGPEP